MRKEKETTINGTKFKVTQLGFADGMELLTTLGRISGPTLAKYQKGTNDVAIFGDIVSRLSATDVLYVTEKLAKTTLIEREPGKWPMLEPEVDLAGNYGLALLWLKFALEVNYSDFFAVGGLLRGGTSQEPAPTA